MATPHNAICTFAGEEGHFTCGCGDCACGGWDGGHQCGPYSCRCQEAMCGRSGEAHRLLESLINLLIITEDFRDKRTPGIMDFKRDMAVLETSAVIESVIGRKWSDIREAIVAERAPRPFSK